MLFATAQNAENHTSSN